VGWKTWSAFALILVSGVAVFTLLPHWVSERPAPEPPANVPASPASEPVPPDSEETPLPRIESEEEIEEALAPTVETDSTPEPAPPHVEAPDDGFAAAMTEALDALKREDYTVARDAFLRAKSLRPAAPDAASGLSQAEEGLRNVAIAGHRDRATEHERLESWRAAEAEYDQALALDGSLRFAREGKIRSAARALLQEKLDFQIGHPERLSDPRALQEASRVLEEAKGVDWGGAKRKEAIARLDALIASYSRPMEVQIVSDTMTDVTLHRIGRLGKFDRRTLEVRPGRYVAVGSRAGFRDVRVEFTVEPGKPLAPIQVRCEEAI
jgi:hypothetical protein